MAEELFDILNDLSFSKKNILANSEDPAQAEKNYIPFLISRGFSYFGDCILYVAELTKYPELDKKLHHDYLFHSLRAKKRFSKWWKKINSSDIEAIKFQYRVSNRKAEEILKLLSNEQLEIIREKMNKGGTEEK